jgi:hypothetical protein
MVPIHHFSLLALALEVGVQGIPHGHSKSIAMQPGEASLYRDNAHVQEELSWMIVKKCKTRDVADPVLLAATVSSICP